MQPIYTCFYTAGTLYETEAERLRRSLDRLGLEHDLRAIPSHGDWVANSRYTATHVLAMLHAYPTRPVVQLDADAVVCHEPRLFDELAEEDLDIAVHWRKGWEMLNGTIFLNPTPGARAVIDRYVQLVQDNPDCTNEQTMLARAINELSASETIRAGGLPAGYCFIPDIMADDVAGPHEVIIAHYQASRQARGCTGAPMDNRKRWIREWEQRMERMLA